jgi:hypothetical protein
MPSFGAWFSMIQRIMASASSGYVIKEEGQLTLEDECTTILQNVGKMMVHHQVYEDLYLISFCF